MENQNNNYICGYKKPMAIIIVILTSIVLIFLTIFLAVSIQYKVEALNNIETKNSINISGRGEIYVKPDLGVMSFSVITEAGTVDEVIVENSLKLNKVIEAIKETGVEEKDLKTTNYHLYPRYEYVTTEIGIFTNSSSKRVLVGYKLTQTVQVKIRDLEKIGDVIESATSVGANSVGDLRLTVDNQEEAQKQAREKAIADAKQKAKTMAEQVGIKLGRIISFSEQSSSPFIQMNSAYGDGIGGVGGAVESPNIQPGENKISSSVNIVYEIK